MAKVVYGPIVQDARNHQGGTVFTRTRAGSMTRRKVSPTQPHTSCQANVRANFTGLSKAWSALSETVRAAWIAFASNNPVRDLFGQRIILTGHQMYVRLNRTLATIGVAAMTNPPANLNVHYVGPVTATHDGPPVTVLNIGWTTPGLMGNEHTVVFATAPMSAGRATAGARFRLIFHSGSGLPGPFNLITEYTEKFGAPITGSKIFFRAMLVDPDNGAQSIPSEVALTI